MDAVSQCPHDGHTDVIHHHGADTAEVNSEVQQRVRQHTDRRAHPLQHAGYNQQSRHSRGHGRDQSEQEVGLDGLPDVPLVLRAEVPGNHHTAAGGNAAEKADDQEGQIAAAADGREGIVACKVADDPGIRHIVKLLQKLTQKHRPGKGQHSFRNAAPGQFQRIVCVCAHDA